MNLSDLCKQYYHVLKALLNKHALITTKSVSQNPPASWMNPRILQSKRRLCYLERVWYKSRSHLDRSHYSKQCHYCNTQMAKAKSDYYTNMVSNNTKNPSQLWNCINKKHSYGFEKLKTHHLNLLILHSFPAYQSNCLQLELLINYELFNPICFGVLLSLGLPRILTQYKYFIYYYLYNMFKYVGVRVTYETSLLTLILWKTSLKYLLYLKMFNAICFVLLTTFRVLFLMIMR